MGVRSQRAAEPTEFYDLTAQPLREDTESSVATSMDEQEAELLGPGRRDGAVWLGGKVGEEMSALTRKHSVPWRPTVSVVSAVALLVLVCLAFISASTPRHPGEDARSEEEAHSEVGPPVEAGAPCSGGVLEGGACPLRSLFADPDVIGVSAANLLRVGSGLLDAGDDKMVIKTVAKVFADVSDILERRAPAVALELDQIDLNTQERDAVLVHLSLLADETVRSFGLDVSRAIRESPSPDSKYLQKHIQMKLVARIREMENYTAQVIPERLLALWGRGRVWSMTLDPTNIRSMETVSGDLVTSLHPAKPLTEEEKMEAVADGALEMVKSLLDLLLLCVRDMGPELDTDIGDTLAVAGDDPLSWPCHVHAGHWNIQADYDKALVCPLKFGAQGLDAMRALTQS